MRGRQKIGRPRGIHGDTMRVAKHDDKIKLFAKFNNKWYSTALEDAFQITNQHFPTRDSVLTFQSPDKGKLIPTILAKSEGHLIIRSQDRSAGVTLKQDSSTLKIRNLADGADAGINVGVGTFTSYAQIDNLKIDGNSIAATNDDGIVTFMPKPTGYVLVGGPGEAGKITSRSGEN